MKVGDYVRTRDGIISKIEDNFNTTMCISTDRGKYHYEYFDIIKSSPNIIDLIEVGDYVNGMEVTMISGTRYDDNDLHCYCEHNINNELREVMIPAKNIRRIVTREQFSQMEYKVKE